MAASMKCKDLLQNLPKLLLTQRRCLGDLRPKPWIHQQRKPTEVARGKLEWARPLMEEQREKSEKGELEEAPSEPPKLFAVSRLKKSLKGALKAERRILERFGLEEKQAKGPSEVAIVKNTEYNNENLRKVKHLIKIVPITFPYGLPKDETDYPHTFLKENGEFIVKPRVEGQIFTEKHKYLIEPETKKKHLQRVLDDKRFIEEYHPAQYKYRFNQDGKETRYNDE